MISGKAFLVAVPLAVGGGWLVYTSHERVRVARTELRQLEEKQQKEADSYVRTLQGSHVERQLEFQSRQQEAVIELASARRNRLLGLMVVAASLIAYAFVRAAQRISAELDEQRRAITGERSEHTGR